MTVRELLETNNMIVDVEIEVRQDGRQRLDAYHIGKGMRKPPYPTRVPKKPEYANSNNILGNIMDDEFYRDAEYVQKSINAKEDGREYWEIKTSRIPKKYLDLEVYKWDCTKAFRGLRNCDFYGKEISIVALPNGYIYLESQEEPKAEQKTEQMAGQISLSELMGKMALDE